MTPRSRWVALLIVVALAIAGSATFMVSELRQYQERVSAASGIGVAAARDAPDGPHIVFRNTAPGEGYGRAARATLADLRAPRELIDQECDRVAAGRGIQVCLRTNRGIVTTFEAVVFDAEWRQLRSWSLPGIPSRTRLSPDGSVLATTSFVTGHSYASDGFSTETVITPPDGSGKSNLEDFDLEVGGQRVTAVDRNFWGVTFAGDGDRFYATAASGGRTWLVEGSFSERTLRAIHSGVECPSLSPDGSTIAYKKNTGSPISPHWVLAVLDLESMTEEVLAEDRNVDDQVEWLDDSTLLYGLPREDSVGETDIWSLSLAGSRPEVFLEHAWSPAVVR